MYEPSQEILQKYADVLVNFALNSGKGVNAGEVVQVVVPDVAKSLALALQNTLLKAGAHPLIKIVPTGFDKDFYNLANKEQLEFFPKKFLKEKVKMLDHYIGVIAEPYPDSLKHVDPQRIFTSRDAKKEYRDWTNDKETAGKFTWTIALWGVEAKATTVGLSLEEYWKQIIEACFLDKEDPIAEWKKIREMRTEILDNLNALKIDYLTVKGDDIDLKVKLGAERLWKGGGGRNIPSFEIFTSPDWRGTEGWVKFNQPLYRYGNVVKDIFLRFKKGKVVEATASEGEAVLKQMLKTKNADKIGEYSITDKRMSRISHVMAETLYDENIGGPFGNTHLAIGMAYKDCYRGDMSTVTKKEWREMGYNDSAEHTDMISTSDRTVTATLLDGSERVIYKDGMYVV